MNNEYPKSCPRKRFAVDVTALPSFTPEEVDAIKAQLYVVNASNQCINPGDLSWIRGYNNTQERMMGKRKGRRKK